LIEDDRAMARSVELMLDEAGFEHETAGTGEVALEYARTYEFDVILLDLTLPDMNGHEVLRQLRQLRINTPVLILSGDAETNTKVSGFGAGADDYVTKPFSPRELVARVRAVLRRLRPALSGGQLEFAGIAMDTTAHRVLRDGRTVQLGPTEFRLLRHFLEHPGRVFSREQLLDAVWGRDVYVEQRTVDVHIRRLRKAVNAGPTGEELPDLIRTVRSAGYSLDGTPAVQAA
jgi:two-component system phosphate regulon response regulator PhoB